MGLRDILQGQKTIRELRSEVAALAKQNEQAERRLADSAEQISHVKREAEQKEQNQCCAVETGQLTVEKKYFEILKPLLLNLPTARLAIAANPALLAKDMIGLFAPMDDFIRAMGLAPIGEVGAEAPYDSTRHDSPDDIAPGTPVRIVTVGYSRGEEIWMKARVKEL